MKRHLATSGYTILEALVVIVITGFLMVTAVTIMDGRQSQIRFEQAVRGYDAQLRSVVNDISTGYFPDTEFQCEYTGGDIVITAGSNQQGTRSDCAFLGKFIEVRNPGSGDLYQDGFDIKTMVGHRRATSLENSALKAIATTDVDLTQGYENRWGMEVVGVVFSDGATTTPVNYFGYLTSLTPAADSDGPRPVSGNTLVGAFYGDHTVAAIDVTSESTRPKALSQDEAIYVCLSMPDSSRKAVIVIGADRGQLTTSVDQDAAGKYTECPTGF